MCRANSRAASQDEDTSTRASISRIVMLAEALFEVTFSSLFFIFYFYGKEGGS